MVWEPVLELFRESIERQGYYHWQRSFPDFKKKYGLKAPSSTPEYLSIDFWSRQRKELTQQGWYILRVGDGSFAVFSEKEHPRPYTQLDTRNAESLVLDIPQRTSSLIDSFKLMLENNASAEDSILELLRYFGVYESLLRALSVSSECSVGPRGNFKSSFKMALRKRNNDLTEFLYNGQVELDYSIWSEDKVFIVEAKSRGRGGLDIGWHKLVFPSLHFAEIARKHDLEVIPVYLLRLHSGRKDQAHFFVFPPLNFHGDIMILNGPSTMRPERVFTVDLSSLTSPDQQKLGSYSERS